MCIYTLKNQKIKKNSKFLKGCATPPNVPKLSVSIRRKGYRKN